MAIPNYFDDIAAPVVSPEPSTVSASGVPNYFSDEPVSAPVEQEQAKSSWVPPHIRQGLTELGQLADLGQAGVQTSIESLLSSEAFRQEDATTAPYRAYNPYASAPSLLTTPEERLDTAAGLRENAAKLRAAAAPNLAAGEQFREGIEQTDAVQRFVGLGLADALQTPSGVLSVFGGPTGLIAVGDAYERSYSEAREAGLSHEEADKIAFGQAAPEVVGIIPAGKFLEKIPVLGPMLKERARKVAGNLVQRIPDPAVRAGIVVAKTSLGEGLEETITGGVQDAITSYMAGSAAAKGTREFASERSVGDLEGLLTNPEFWANRGRDFRAGVVSGGALGTPGAVRTASRDFQQAVTEQTAGTEQAILDTFEQQTATPEPTVEQPVMEEEAVIQDIAAAEPVTVEAAPAANEPVNDDTRKSELGKIHMAKRTAGLDDTAYRELLTRVTGKDSAAKLTPEERKAVMTELGLSPEQQVVKPKAPKKVEKPKAKPGTIDAELENMASKLGLDKEPLGMAASARPAYDPEEFRATAKRVATKLAGTNKQSTADVQNLIRQGKLVVAPNAESINRDTTEDAAQYDPKTGKMYLYTDSVDVEQVPELMAAALHESTHAGQFNDRTGRPNIFKQMMGENKYVRANSTVLRAAEQGNRVAQQAVELAREAAGSNAELENLEVIPYFVSEATKARSLGTLGTLAGDIRAAGRSFLRKGLKMNLDLSLEELSRASQKVAGEIVQTDLAPAEGDTLSMVLPARATTGAAEAQAEGRVYTDPVDAEEKFVISDQLSDLTQNPDKLRQVKNDGAVLSQIMSHPELYKQIPSLRGVRVEVLKGQDAMMFGGMARPEIDTIYVNPGMLESATSGEPQARDLLRSVLLHEAQHIVQAKGTGSSGGSSAVFYTETDQNQIKRLNRLLKERKDAASALLQTLERSVETDPIEDAQAAANQILSDPDIYTRHEVNMAKEFDNLDNRVTEQQTTVDVINGKYHDAYMRIHGEREAYWTERNRNKSLANLPVNPTAVPEAEGGLPRTNEEAFVTTRDKTGRMTVAPSRVSSSRTIDIPDSNSADFAELAQQPLGMAASKAPRAREEGRTPTWLKGLFSSSQGTGRVINEITEYARSSPAAARMEAESYMGKYKVELRKLAKRRGISETALSEQIAKAIDSVDQKSDSYESNLEAFRTAVKPYGEVGKVLVDYRNAVDALSLDILRQRTASGKPLTESEKKTYVTVMNNLGRYAHRQFASNLYNNSYSEAVWDSYLKAKEKNPKLTEADRNNAKRVVNALKRLVDDITIPDTEVLEEMNGDEINRLYDVWSSNRNPDALTVDDKRQELDEMRDDINGDSNLMRNQAETIAQEILGLMGDETGLVASYYRGGKQDTGILQKRKEISPQIRELMGEIKDPAMRLFTTAAKQAEFVSRTRMLMELTQVDNPYHLQPPGPSGRPEVKGMKQLKGEAFGPLENYYVSPELFNLVSDQVEYLASFEQAVAMAAQRPNKLTNTTLLKAIDVWGNIAGTAKMLQIIGKPANFLFNFLGGPRMMLMNGNINPATFTEAFSTAAELIGYARNPGKGVRKKAQRVNALGITDSAFIGEINSEQYRELQNVVKQMVGKKPSTAWEMARKAGLSLKETYAMMDVIFKIANFYHQADRVLPDYYKAAGIKKTQNEIDREAADIVSRTNITYKRAAPIVKAMERGGLTQFGTYFYEVFRTEVANIRQGIEEMNRARNAPNAKAAAIMGVQAARRIGGQLASWGLTAALSSALGAATFGEDEEDKYLRYLLPDFARNQDFVLAGKDENGQPVYFDWSRFDPAGPATDIMRRIINGDAKPSDIADEIFDLYIAPRIGTRIIEAVAATAGMETRNPPRPFVQQIFPDAYENVLTAAKPVTQSDRATRAWTTVGESFLPGFIDGLKESNPKPVTVDAFSGVTNAMRYGGAMLFKASPSKAARSAGFMYQDTIRRERAKLGDLTTDRPNLDASTASSIVLAAKEREMETFMELRNVYRGMRAAGLSDEEAAAVLKDARIPQEVIPQVMSGEFESRVVSEDSFGKLKDNAVKKAEGEKEKERVEKRWDDVWELLQGATEND